MKELTHGTIVREVTVKGGRRYVSAHNYVVVKVLNKQKALCIVNKEQSCNREFKLPLQNLEIVEGGTDVRFQTRDFHSYIVNGELHFLGRQFIEDGIKKVTLWCYDGKGGTKSFVCSDKEAMGYFDQEKTSEGIQAESIGRDLTRGF